MIDLLQCWNQGWDKNNELPPPDLSVPTCRGFRMTVDCIVMLSAAKHLNAIR